MSTLIYLHIPKAAGTSLRGVVDSFYSEDKGEIYYIRDNIYADRRRFGSMSREFRSNVNMVFGHICWGWHQMIPGDAKYITILRNPTDRVYSLYNYIYRSRGHFLHDEVRNMSLTEFVESGVHAGTDNGMVRQLCGDDRFYNKQGKRLPYNESIIPYGEVTHKHLARARDNLSACALVSTVPHFNDFVRSLCNMLDRNMPWFRIRNKTPQSQKRPLTCDERVVIARYNRLDWELYLMAQGLSNEIASGVWKT